ncbi:Aerotolerance-related protein domain-containing protein [Desulfonema limicola]|uniref:Aerotolerance-related protein domain-containing protein n=1 Tax=Desulfonema limicola TaxID=45656 RepID=A0A975B9K7_9BACT|nr:Aerotolerance-related protein domain-containing protein [Desulfonema limicola]
MGESLELSISISGDKGTVDINPIKDFKVVSRGTTSSIKMINTSFSQEIIYKYSLIPVKEGKLVIPPLPVKSDGKTYQTQAIDILVSENTQTSQEGTREVFVTAEVSNTSPFEGQQFIYTFKFFQSVQITNARLQQPEFSGLTSAEIEKRKTYNTVISGREYHVTELNYILVPLKPGQITIEPALLSCDIVKRSSRRRGFFDDPFFNRNLESRVYKTQALNIDVQPLPAYEGEGMFSGLVGSFDISSEIENHEINVGDSVTLSITIQGTGNIMDAEEPEIQVSDAFKTYKDTPEEAVQMDNTGYFGKKIFRMALVPVKPGEFTLPPVSLVYFNTAAGKYEFKKTREINLKVNPSKEKDSLEVYSAPSEEKKPLKKKVEFTGRDILPLKEDINALEIQETMSLSKFIILLMVPCFLCFGVKSASLIMKKNSSPSKIMSERAEKALKQASCADSSGEEFLTCLYKALISAILSKAGVTGESLTCAEAREILQSRGYSPETSDQAAKLLEKIESARFSGLANNMESGRELLLETGQMLKRLS